MTENLSLKVVPERPVVRNDETSDIDIAIDILTSTTVGAQPASYAINLCVVIDRSGSMGSGDKLEHAKRSCIEIYNSLNASDRFTVLAFDDFVVTVVNPQTPPDDVRKRIQSLQPGGMTNLSKGWYLGLLELQTYSSENHINRLILLSDGIANEGEQKPSVLGAESARAREELGITTSTIGIGSDFQEDILAALAQESGGRFWFIGEARIEEIIKEEFSGALSVYLERPRVELDLPASLMLVKELNDLPKVANRYRIRPIKANDRFCFAMRLRVDPDAAEGAGLAVGATLLDGADIVTRSETTLELGSVEEYVQSPEDPLVSMVVAKYLAASSDEQIVRQVDAGNVDTMIEMLQSQSDLMRELERKLAGATAISWDVMSDEQRAEAEMRRQAQEEELARLRMELEENTALVAVGELVDLMQGLGKSQSAADLLSHARKMHRHREERNRGWGARGDMDDWSASSLLSAARSFVPQLIDEFPHLRDELTRIGERVDEQLAHFS